MHRQRETAPEALEDRGHEKMDIVIVSSFTGDLSKSNNDRFLYLARMLSEDNQVELITSRFYHTAKRFHDDPQGDWPFKITLIDEPGYPRNICLQRLHSHWVFGRNLASYLSRRSVPDVVYCAFPPINSAKVVADYCRAHDVRFVLDIQDLWPEAFEMVFHVPPFSNMAFAPLYRQANAVFSAADELCAVSDTYLQRALEANSSCHAPQVVNLGTDLETFDANSGKPLDIEKRADELWMAYCGTLGESYDLPIVLEALSILAEEGKPAPLFFVMGDGPRKEEFERCAEEHGLGVVFTGRLPYDEMCSLLKMCDFAVNPIVGNAPQSIINKHADYAAAGLPVLSTQESPEYRDLVDSYQMGFNVENGNARELADRILELCSDKEQRFRMGQSARRCAEERFDRKRTYRNLIKAVEGSA